jgi:23S rRNA (adenine2030-N6)-methyltransferase
MNYRHSYHAGNHTEVFKHSVLGLLLQHLLRKPQPFMVLDTHAGAGMYDLTAEPARKTGEARDGIGRIINKEVPAAAAYMDLVRRLNPTSLSSYPGSPAIAQAFLRDADKLIACELRDDDAALLRANFRDDRRVSVHRRDGYEAMGALLPPQTKRGLVFVDPPFERPDEFASLANALNLGIKKWRTGIFVAWYPLKEGSETRYLSGRYRTDNPPTLCCAFLREQLDGVRLAGSGLVICNPPWEFEKELTALCLNLLAAFEAQKGTFSLDWWVPERV